MGLLLAAFPPELGPLAEAPPRGWDTACTGVGALTAAATTARLLAESRPEAVVFLGTCGRYDERLGLFECLWATEAIATSLEEVRGGAYPSRCESAQAATGIERPLPRSLYRASSGTCAGKRNPSGSPRSRATSGGEKRRTPFAVRRKEPLAT